MPVWYPDLMFNYLSFQKETRDGGYWARARGWWNQAAALPWTFGTYQMRYRGLHVRRIIWGRRCLCTAPGVG